MSTAPIRRADPTEAETLARVVAKAFDSLPLCQWMVPDPAERRRILPDNFAITVEHGLRHGAVYTTDNLDGVAVWFTDAPKGVPDIPDYDERLLALCGVHTPRFQALDEAMHRVHPTDRAAHDYLVFLAVDPAVQSNRLGARLLAEHHSHLDRSGTPAYLDASGLRSRALYLRNGYVDINRPFGMPDGGPDPVMWPMWREPA